MDVPAFLEQLQAAPDYRGQLVYHTRLPAREARYAAPATPLSAPVTAALRRVGVERLYTHQAAALEAARAGRDVVVMTATASGKTLCYNLPVVERLLAEPAARALYLFPTKALAQDQLKGLERLTAADERLRQAVRALTFDGDTPAAARRRARDEAHILLTNPDMLHVSLLPYHAKWAGLLARLRYVVVDEVHTYRGIFGSHVANVLRRLVRLCAHYGSRPTFIATSATIANPAELASTLIGRPVDLVDDDGSPRAPKHLVFWNPGKRCLTPFSYENANIPAKNWQEKRCLTPFSANVEAQGLMARLVGEGVQTLAFARTRTVAELLARYVRQTLQKSAPARAQAVASYRGGYLPEERRRLEEQLSDGRLVGVTSTNALELGIDVGGLDAAILVGYPGTIASLWQQAGRAGRRQGESLVILVAHRDPIDQYMMRHPAYLLSRSPEHGVLDPANPHILQGHLACAAFELPLAAEDAAHFGETARPLADLLVEDGQLQPIAGRYYWARSALPALDVGLRHSSHTTFTILDVTDGPGTPLGQVDSTSAPELVYPGGVYLHEGESYVVRELDFDGKVARVARSPVDYYTQAVLESSVQAVRSREQRECPGSVVHFGDVAVTWQTVAYTKHLFYSQHEVGREPMDLPAQTLLTTGLWFVPTEATLAALAAAGHRPIKGLVGLRNMLLVALPLLAMADPRDVSANVEWVSPGTGPLPQGPVPLPVPVPPPPGKGTAPVPLVFAYDRYPGGVGYARKGYDRVDQLLALCRRIVEDCPCADGCPSCVGVPNLRPAIHSDIDLSGGYPVPDKVATVALLELLF